jgi:soluble lytic murein transglycosylase
MRGISSSNQRLARIAPRIFLCGSLAACLAIGPLAGPKLAQAAETASLPADTRKSAAPLPDILSKADRVIYSKIFTFQEDGDWRSADRLIRQLDDKVLMGHVKAQRYLHPTKYRSRYVELSDWLKSYADHPDARRIYTLALSRKPQNYRPPTPPSRKFYPSYAPTTIIEHSGYRPAGKAARSIIHQVQRMTRHRQLSQATKYIDRKDNARRLGPTGYDLARTHVASGWFFHGDGKRAYDMARPAAERSGHQIPYAHWIAGLSAYRLGKFVEAAGHFESVAQSDKVTGFDHAAAAFWAARSNMTGQRPERVNHWLEMAAAQPRTFYGIIARRWLGEKSPFDWESPVLSADRLQRITSQKAGRRAFALLEAGQNARAGRELRFMSGGHDREMTKALIAMADRLSLPMVSYRAGASLVGDEDETLPASALYPLPKWKPQEGFQVDRALVFAFMRQESAFNVRARSPVGARGLMQLMPATAGFVAQKRFSGKQRDLLYDPSLNISLGQQYILHLLENDHVNGDLLLLAAAYNGGPGNLKKWQRRAEKGAYTDALMFIESIPARETRIFIERVLSNLWMYRERLGEPAPSLDALAAGERPVYIAVDGSNGSVAEDVRN